MADIFTKEERSKIMSKIRSKNNTSTELKLIKIFKEYGITGWRRNYNTTAVLDDIYRVRLIDAFWYI